MQDTNMQDIRISDKTKHANPHIPTVQTMIDQSGLTAEQLNSQFSKLEHLLLQGINGVENKKLIEKELGTLGNTAIDAAMLFNPASLVVGAVGVGLDVYSFIKNAITKSVKINGDQQKIRDIFQLIYDDINQNFKKE